MIYINLESLKLKTFTEQNVRLLLTDISVLKNFKKLIYLVDISSLKLKSDQIKYIKNSFSIKEVLYLK